MDAAFTMLDAKQSDELGYVLMTEAKFADVRQILVGKPPPLNPPPKVLKSWVYRKMLLFYLFRHSAHCWHIMDSSLNRSRGTRKQSLLQKKPVQNLPCARGGSFDLGFSKLA